MSRLALVPLLFAALVMAQQGPVKKTPEVIKAEIETDNWHTHAEVPNPLPADSKLWVEIEAEGGAKTLAGFAL